MASREGRSTRYSLLAIRRSLEQRVDVVLRHMARVAVELRTVEQLGVALALRLGLGDQILEGDDAAPDLHHARHVRLDEFPGVDDLADALAGDVLEITRLEYVH